MIDTLIRSLVESSKLASSVNGVELAQHQEATLQAIGFWRMRDVPLQRFSVDECKEFAAAKPLTSAEIVEFFGNDDVALFADDNDRFALLYYIECEELFEGVPIFWQNYVAEQFLPAVLMVCIERLKISDQIEEFMALPYFTIFKLDEAVPYPVLAFVGAELRQQALEDPQKATADAMSNIAIFLPLVTAGLLANRAHETSLG